MALIDNGIYVDGVRTQSPTDLRRTYDALDAAGGGAMAWIGLFRPTDAELTSVADEFGLHPLAVEDASKGHQRAKLERYGDTLFVVLRPAWYDHDAETVEFGEVHLFTGDGFVVTVRHAARPNLADVRKRLETDPEWLGRGSEAVLCAVLDEVVDGYAPVVAGLQDDVDEIEDDLFDGDVDPDSSKRIYQLLSEVIGFQRAISPLPGMARSLLLGAEKYGTDPEVQNQLRNVLDHAIRITERADTFRALLENALTLHATLVTQEQNDAMRRMTSASLAQGEESRRLAQASMRQGEEVKKISSWAAILFAPTLVASIYGMNFDHMPELHWTFGYPFAIVLMLVMAVVLWFVFKRRGWL
ncbi:magnesium and cobalt transport protein CorA [Curtobacterium sp. MCBA15_004]|uniref:magnesium and cobalt transport protein CorA n=1 Tax=unclassified Curtobacterium TaxID=257496 RepID=UPI0008DE9E94|nr:magnesium and cobalt transport protein CorA [Curtobacterium sp. MCBA15_004]WIA98352.1 magnesium and cobalt transport protein CorA [Curtobacterium sp. MCBA15_004]